MNLMWKNAKTFLFNFLFELNYLNSAVQVWNILIFHHYWWDNYSLSLSGGGQLHVAVQNCGYTTWFDEIDARW